MDQVSSLTGVKAKRVIVDKGYRGKEHHPEGVEVEVCGTRKVSYYKKELHRRRSCVEAIIGHMKAEARMNRNLLLGTQGDAINTVLVGASLNFKKLMLAVRPFSDFAQNIFKSYRFDFKIA